MTKLKNSNCDKTWKLKLRRKSKTKIVTKLKTQIVTKLKNLNCEETQKLTDSSPSLLAGPGPLGLADWLERSNMAGWLELVH